MSTPGTGTGARSVLHAQPIETDGLTKHFERRRPARRPWELLRRRARDGTAEPTVAVEDVTLQVVAGEIYGLLGPNGAGKITTARMLSTLLEPAAGHARICGYNAVRRSIGVMFAGERGVYWRLTGRENLELFGRLQFMSGGEIRRCSGELLEHLGLGGRGDELLETYSTGMKQRLNLARTLLHDPPVLLLDEPHRCSGPGRRACHARPAARAAGPGPGNRSPPTTCTRLTRSAIGWGSSTTVT